MKVKMTRKRKLTDAQIKAVIYTVISTDLQHHDQNGALYSIVKRFGTEFDTKRIRKLLDNLSDDLYKRADRLDPTLTNFIIENIHKVYLWDFEGEDES
jgi:predicted class III extradiol MEMO1 family dioxygenase